MTLGQARRLALRAQGLTGGAATIRKALARTKLLQLDSVNVVERAHYFPIFSRIGAYDKAALDEIAWSPRSKKGPGRRGLVEYWAHEAALIPFEDWPAFRWRMEEYQHGRWHIQEELIAERAALGQKICALLDESGPATAGELERRLGLDPQGAKGPWWDRGETKIVCEALFAAGVLTAGKRVNFNRHYDLVENVVPREFREVQLTREESVLRLVANAADALGIATEQDLRDYYRLDAKDTKAAVVSLLASGELEEAQVRGWSQPAYLVAGASVPRAADARALLCPFDPLVFFRPRLERLFEFRYRIEIYTPQHKREHGYYVFPFLLGDRLVARVDLKADRKAGVLLAHGAFLEDHATALETAEPLAASLGELAGWLGLEAVRIGGKGDLAPALQQIFRSRG
ncbi:winged helix-turn-helix domain-containing protein [Segniliparus rugosus]|uniref:winged helix-turn-helix domain-containing protein n=1 Tax=Segniliparus rugosus TaxID=286804 RepID=UPI00058B5250|nr:crosslink repair DNA glycosylase YcaQ family protein [Segniliparus rugosus]